jgi:acetyl-CoA acetyltransferase
MSVRNNAAIAGLGITPMGKIFGRSSVDFAAEAIQIALEDAGLDKSELDGLLVNQGPTAPNPLILQGGGGIGLQPYLGIPELRLNLNMQGGGATAGQMVHFAAMAVQEGLASVVACVFADAPLREGAGAGAAYGGAGRVNLSTAHGKFGALSDYAMAAQRHMHQYGTKHEHFGAVAVSQRKWANMNPRAQMREKSLSLEDYLSSRWIVEPFRLFDCCLVSNGGVAVIVTSAERARNLRKPPIYIHGLGQAHFGHASVEDAPSIDETPIKSAGKAALEMAGLKINDIDVAEVYDCFTYTVMIQLEDLGLCGRGEGGAFVEDGKTAPGGSIPVNTGGGSLSSYYMWGMTPLSEGIIQARGEAEDRQVKEKPMVLVTTEGGQPWAYGAVTILSAEKP